MKKLALGALFVGLVAACGGGKNNPPVVIDGTGGDDGPGPTLCNPIMQTGCEANEKCTWVWDQVMPAEVGHIGCAVLAGDEVAVGATCTDGRMEIGMGGDGADNCVKGAVCISRICKTICDQNAAAAASGCTQDENCGTYSGIFESGDSSVAGACDPKCDALNQNLLAGQGPTAACGSTDPAVPNQGCYGARRFSNWSCAAVVEESILMNTDRQPPFQENGQFFINSCAPGYTILIAGMTGSQTPVCSGLCAAGNISNQGNEPQNDTGVDAATAKLVNQAAPRAGDGLCIAAAKGSASGGPQNCAFLWTFTINGQNVEIAPEYLDNLGFCFSYNQYMFDSDGNMTPDTVFPPCQTLPKRSAQTTGDSDDAADFGCQTLAESMFDSKIHVPMTKDLRIGLDNMKVKPHKLGKY